MNHHRYPFKQKSKSHDVDLIGGRYLVTDTIIRLEKGSNIHIHSALRHGKQRVISMLCGCIGEAL